MSTTTIPIDRPTRDVLHRDLVYELEGAGDALAHLNHTSRDEAAAEIERAKWALGMLDAIGFDERNGRHRYEMPIDERVREWLRKLRAEQQQSIDDDRNSLEHLEAGDEDYCHIGRTMRQSIEHARPALAIEEAELAIVDALLGEVDDPIGAVA